MPEAIANASGNIFREYHGGPFHGEVRAVESCLIGTAVPLPISQRRHPEVPEWVQYCRDGDRMIFVGRFKSIDDCIRESIEWDNRRTNAILKQKGLE